MKVIAIFLFLLLVSNSSATTPPKNGVIPKHLLPYFDLIRKDYDQGFWAKRMRERSSAKMLHGTQNSVTQISAIETVFVPILFGKYSNSTTKQSPSTFQEMLFTGPNPTGTSTQFYWENSYGQLFFTGECIGWFPVPQTFQYYVHDGGDNAGLNYGGRDFTIDLLVEADKTIDFSKFVKYVDAEGAHVPQLGIVHTGADAAAGADNIWSHRWNVRGRFIERKNSGTESTFDINRVLASGRYITNDSLNGKRVIFDGDYAIHPELSGSSNTAGSPKPIGVFTHEFGHIFGLPDLYDTDNSSEGLGNWCVMAGGSYGGDGAHEATPVNFSAWCKEKLGWISPKVVDTFLSQQQIRYSEKYADYFKIFANGNPAGEYFLIENRQKYGFDKFIFSGGILIYHVDPTRTSNSNENRPMVDLEEADGLAQLSLGGNRGDAGDPFPGSTNNRSFDGYTNPDSRTYSSAQSYVGVRKISSSDTIMYANLDVGSRPYCVIDNVQFVEQSYQNGRIDPGENGYVVLNAKNIYPVAATNTTISVKSLVSDVLIDSLAKSFDLAGLTAFQDTLAITVVATPQAMPRIIPVTVTITTPQEVFSKTANIVLGFPKTVVIDLDTITTDNITAYYQLILDSINVPYEQISAKNKTLSNLSPINRDIMIVASGRKRSDIIPDSLGSQLLTFISNGGKVFLSGQNIAEDLKQRNSPLQHTLIRSTWTGNVTFGKVLIGIGEDKFGMNIPKLTISGGDAIGNQISPDIISIDTGNVHPTFRWNSTTNSNYGGLWWENNVGGKLVYWSFGLEGVNGLAAGSSSRVQALSSIINWFRNITPTPVASVFSKSPTLYALSNNFPNPFNPSTIINYALPAQSHVVLKVYDVVGKEVATLVNDIQSSGYYTTTFNASHLASGLYFYTLRAGSFMQTRKMVLIK